MIRVFHIATDYGGRLDVEGIRNGHDRCLNQCVGYFGTTEINISAVSTTPCRIGGDGQGVYVTMIAYREFKNQEEAKKWGDWWHGTKTR